MKRDAPFRDPDVREGLTARLAEEASELERPVTFMEVCGTHTHAIAEAGLRRAMPDGVKLISGPGCPVCVTPIDYVDRAEALAKRSDTIVCTFGDLIRVPSSRGSLERARADGADVRIVYSPRDALRVARENPDRRVVFLAVGFETTMPTIAAALEEAEITGVPNFQVLPGAKLIEPPLRALIQDPDVAVDGFLLPGHVSVIVGARLFRFLEDEFRIPAVVVGFAPNDVLGGVLELVQQIRRGAPRLVNLYGRVVRDDGNPTARRLVEKFFEPADTGWRGLGEIPLSGLALRPEWGHRDASRVAVDVPPPKYVPGCRCGEILKGTIEPPECKLFARACTPDRPLGACMVSSEGTCAAWYRHERLLAGGPA